jgi:type IX secretion system PorP/SprF family membrane protein
MSVIMKKTIYILLFVVIEQISFGQQLPLYSQYLYNKFLINPAVAGSDGYTSLNLTARKQWIGLSGSPQIFSFSVQTRFLKRRANVEVINKKTVFRPQNDAKVGLGATVFSYQSGLIQRTGFQFAYAYHLWLHKMTQLSFGLSFTGTYFRINEKMLNLEDQNDPSLNDNLRRGIFMPDATFGIYLLNRKYNIGFSAYQLFGGSAKIGNVAYSNYNLYRHYYLFGSYSLEPRKDIELRPSVLIMMSEQQIPYIKPLAEIGLNFIYNESFWAGLSYRTSGAIIANIGVKYTNIYIGYAFDYTLQEVQRITYGTHELNVAWKFGDSARRYRWLDRY